MSDNDKTSVNSVPQVPDKASQRPLPKFESFTDFESLEVIGKGGYGVCCKGKRKMTDEVFAVKIFHFDPSEITDYNTAVFLMKDAESRFRDEIRTLAKLRAKKLRHPNIVELGDAAESPCPHYWMEFVAGPQGKPQNLYDLLGNKRLKLKDALRFALQAAVALQYLHSQGIIHRDIKPQNILIDAKNNVKITDFGFAKRIQEESTRTVVSQTGVGLSSGGYVAPEVRENLKSADERSDIWSLGTVICRMVSGQKTYSKHVFRRCELSEQWDDLIDGMLAEKPKFRIQTMDEVITALQNISDKKLGTVKPDVYVDTQPMKPDLQNPALKISQPTAKARLSEPSKLVREEMRAMIIPVLIYCGMILAMLKWFALKWFALLALSIVLLLFKRIDHYLAQGIMICGTCAFVLAMILRVSIGPVQTLEQTQEQAEAKADELLEFLLKGVKWRFRWCPAGSFTASSSNIMLRQGFWMGETEVTQEQWLAVMGNNPSYFKGDKSPVEQVSWDDCQEFVKKFNEKLKEAGTLVPAGIAGALPTESQWEYACRAGSTTAYCFGDDAWLVGGNIGFVAIDKLGDYAWYEWNSSGKTHPVGEKKTNAWGLYDMHGNVWEWCQDRCGCGGSWGSNTVNCRSGARYVSSLLNNRQYFGLRLSLVSESK